MVNAMLVLLTRRNAKLVLLELVIALLITDSGECNTSDKASGECNIGD